MQKTLGKTLLKPAILIGLPTLVSTLAIFFVGFLSGSLKDIERIDLHGLFADQLDMLVVYFVACLFVLRNGAAKRSNVFPLFLLTFIYLTIGTFVLFARRLGGLRIWD